jgi:hypothetical protein
MQGAITMQQPVPQPNLDQERSRLVDHFKRAYQIVVGLSITLACTKLFPTGFVQFPLDTSFWLFCAFFITVVPIFHGGDRSLDIKYLQPSPPGFWRRFAYIWDVYMLLITAILFVKIAQAIPLPKTEATSAIFSAVPAPTKPDFFYRWMAAMLAFDVFILIVDWIKSALLKIERRSALSGYILWIVLNSLLFAVCLGAAVPLDFVSAYSEQTIAFAVFLFAFTRTFIDYIAGKKFMFP